MIIVIIIIMFVLPSIVAMIIGVVLVFVIAIMLTVVVLILLLSLLCLSSVLPLPVFQSWPQHGPRAPTTAGPLQEFTDCDTSLGNHALTSNHSFPIAFVPVAYQGNSRLLLVYIFLPGQKPRAATAFKQGVCCV